ncbi:hypothetical protein TNCV_1476031 [Trichonephila clavipes]|nr:hypothetical protein TNCV_1476031 [Trichonephila clavipes]
MQVLFEIPHYFWDRYWGCSSPVVKVSDHGRHCNEFKPSTTKDLPRRGAMHVKSVKSSSSLPLAALGPNALFNVAEHCVRRNRSRHLVYELGRRRPPLARI